MAARQHQGGDHASERALPQLDITAATRHDYLFAGAVPVAALRRRASSSAAAAPPPPPSSSSNTLRLPMFLQSSAVLFPGHRLPLVIPRSLLLALTSSSPPNPLMVVVVNASAAPMRRFGGSTTATQNAENDDDDDLFVVGCTAEVTHVESSDAQTQDQNNTNTAFAIVTGRQRAFVHLPPDARTLAPWPRHHQHRASLWLVIWHAQTTINAHRGGIMTSSPILVDVTVPLDGEDSAACGAPPAAAARGCRGPPPPFRNNTAAWPRWATRPFDAPLLARVARDRVAAILPAVGGFEGGPAELGYYLAHNLPLPDAEQQRLLECRSSVARLRALLRLLRRLEGKRRRRRSSGSDLEEEARQEQPWWEEGGGDDEDDDQDEQADERPAAAENPPPPPPVPRLILGCGWCGGPLADAAQALRCTEEGVAGAFINAHGAVHDILTVRRLFGFEEQEGEDDDDQDDDDETTTNRRRRAAVFYQGRPETEHSWFPGYSWHICCCAHCHNHLGWRFRRVEGEAAAAAGAATATASSEGPRVFWGLRRDMLLPMSLEDVQRVSELAIGGGDDDDDDEEEEEESGEGGG